MKRASPLLGIDAYSLRSQGWTALEYLDYCHSLGAHLVHFSEIRFLGSLEPAFLQKVKERASDLQISLEIGMRSICPTSNLFDASQGTAAEQLERMICAARIVGSKVVRAFMGNAADRTGGLSVDQHIENTVRELRAVRHLALDAGVKIAVENHSGDLQAPELKTLIEEAGTDFVGACIDSGNPLITLEDPHFTLETLSPYVLTSHLRDTAVWKNERGIQVAWVRMGHGNVGIDSYLRRFVELCPNAALALEIILSPGPRTFPYQEESFWSGYSAMPAWQFSRFLTLAERGSEYHIVAPATDQAATGEEREALESSMTFTSKLLDQASGRG